jgi:predicted DNA-binding transcriptional regulator AlpA
MNDEVLNKKEAAQFLKMSIANLSRLMKEKRIPYSKVNGRVLFLKNNLIKWLKKHEVK